MGGFAWVTLATNDSYSLGALVLGHALKQAGTIGQLVVLVTPGVTTSMRAKLSDVFNIVQQVNILDSKDETNLRLLKRPELGVTFTKLHCWRLTQYDKCVFLDADTLILSNCDELFQRDEFSAAPDVGWPDCFNSGVFVFKPSIATYESLIKFALENGSFDGGDQGLLNLFFSDWAHKDISKRLPFIYNMCSIASYSYLPAFRQFGGQVKIVHFIGVTKPWLQYFETESKQVQPTAGTEHLKQHLQLWWNIFCKQVHPVLTPDMSSAEQKNSSDNRTVHSTSQIPSTFITSPHNHFIFTAITPDPWLYYQKTDFDRSIQYKSDESHNTNSHHVETPSDAQVHTLNHESILETNVDNVTTDYEIDCSNITDPDQDFQSQIVITNVAVETSTLIETANLPFTDLAPDNNIINTTMLPSSSDENSIEDNPDPPPDGDSKDGLASAFAQFTLGSRRSENQSALEDHLRRQCWEVGNIDYLGRDSFSNIWNKISETMGSSAPHADRKEEQVIAQSIAPAKPEIPICAKLDAAVSKLQESLIEGPPVALKDILGSVQSAPIKDNIPVCEKQSPAPVCVVKPAAFPIPAPPAQPCALLVEGGPITPIPQVAAPDFEKPSQICQKPASPSQTPSSPVCPKSEEKVPIVGETATAPICQKGDSVCAGLICEKATPICEKEPVCEKTEKPADTPEETPPKSAEISVEAPVLTAIPLGPVSQEEPKPITPPAVCSKPIVSAQQSPATTDKPNVAAPTQEKPGSPVKTPEIPLSTEKTAVVAPIDKQESKPSVAEAQAVVQDNGNKNNKNNKKNKNGKPDGKQQQQPKGEKQSEPSKGNNKSAQKDLTSSGDVTIDIAKIEEKPNAPIPLPVAPESPKEDPKTKPASPPKDDKPSQKLEEVKKLESAPVTLEPLASAPMEQKPSQEPVKEQVVAQEKKNDKGQGDKKADKPKETPKEDKKKGADKQAKNEPKKDVQQKPEQGKKNAPQKSEQQGQNKNGKKGNNKGDNKGKKDNEQKLEEKVGQKGESKPEQQVEKRPEADTEQRPLDLQTEERSDAKPQQKQESKEKDSGKQGKDGKSDDKKKGGKEQKSQAPPTPKEKGKDQAALPKQQEAAPASAETAPATSPQPAVQLAAAAPEKPSSLSQPKPSDNAKKEAAPTPPPRKANNGGKKGKKK